MSPRYAYFYLMKDDPGVGATVPRHVAHWHDLRLRDYLGGPFQDRSGGLITFESADAQTAQEAVRSDPFLEGGLLTSHWLKEWAPDERERDSKNGQPAGLSAQERPAHVGP